MSHQILEKLLNDLTPKNWYDYRIPERYTDIVKLVSEKVSPESARVFAEPKILDSAYEGKIEAQWFVPAHMAGAVPVSSLSPAEQTIALEALNSRVKQILDFANALLLAEKPENIRWGQLLRSACTCPSLDYVYVKEGEVVMTAWGFRYVDDKSGSGIASVQKEEKPEIAYPFIPQATTLQAEPKVVEPEPPRVQDVFEPEPVQNIDKETAIINEPSDQSEKVVGATPVQEAANKKKTLIQEPTKSGFDLWKWMKYLLLLLLLLIFIFGIFKGCNHFTGGGDSGIPPITNPDNPEDPYKPDPDNPEDPDKPDPDNPEDPDKPNPDNPDPDDPVYPYPPKRKIAIGPGPIPIDSPVPPWNEPNPPYSQPIPKTKIKVDPTNRVVIVRDRLNIALTGSNKDIHQFSKDFKKLYPADEYKILYGEQLTARLQVKLPEEEVAAIRKNLKSKLNKYQMLIWHESIFTMDNTSNDPGFRNNNNKWYFEAIQAFDAWNITQGSEDVIIAVLDAGFDLDHPELKGRIVNPYNTVYRSNKKEDIFNGSVDNAEHGTHVAATCVGNINNKEGVSGIAPKSKVLPVVVAYPSGTMSSSHIIDGVLYAMNQGAKVINLSLGLRISPSLKNSSIGQQQQVIDNSWKDEEAFWDELYSIASRENVTIVRSGGNDNVLIGLDPAKRSSYAIRVSAVKDKESKAKFSNWGDDSDISAPGKDIYNAVPRGEYSTLSGTSMAAPIVSAAAALMYSVNPSMTAYDVKLILNETGKPLGSAGNKDIGPLLQLADALNYAQAGKVPPVPCQTNQEKIDELQEEINRLKMDCNNR